MFKLTAMDMSFDENRVYLAGLSLLNGNAGQPIVVTCDLNETMFPSSSILLTDIDYGTPHRIKRMRGQEILVIACDKHFAIVEWTPSGLIQLGSVRNVHDNQICDFVLRGKFLYSKAYNEPMIKSTELGVKPNEALMVNSPYTNFQTIKIENQALAGLEKVVVNRAGDKMYTGGKGLHLFQRNGNLFKPIDLDINRGKHSPFPASRI